MPSRAAASIRRPPVRASARMMRARSNCAAQRVQDAAYRRAPGAARLPARGRRPSRRPWRRCARAARPAGRRLPPPARAAITVSQWQRFSSWRTLPGKSSRDRWCSASSDSRFGSTPSIARAGGEEVPRQQRDVLGALAQARQAQADDVEAVIEVLAERALAHALLEVLVGGGDHPHVDLHLLVPADAIEGAVRQHAQQPGLQLRRHVADLVEEQGAALGLLEAAAPLLLGAGKRAALVAEQLRLRAGPSAWPRC